MMEHEDVVRLPVSIKELNTKINQAKTKVNQVCSTVESSVN